MSQLMTLFSWPKEIFFGNNASEEIGRYIAKEKSLHRVLIVTDEGVVKNNLLDQIKESLNAAVVDYEIYDEVKQDAPDDSIMEALEQFNKAKADLLIAVGGGSAIDTAKAAGILHANGGKIQDYEGIDKVQENLPAFYAVPTTAGCGSEASQFCICLDAKKKIKIGIFSRRVIPQRVFIDPLLTLSMPPELTAGCGIDALNNSIESFFSTWASPITDALSLHAIRLISENLRATVANGKNVDARKNMAVAALEAGLAFTNAQCGAVQALGQSLTGAFQIPQRVSNGILLPHVMRHNLNTNMDRMIEVAKALGEQVNGLSKREAAEKAISAVKWLLVDIGLPKTLGEVGVTKEAISALSQQASKNTFLRTNPASLTQREISKIYENAFLEYEEPFPAPNATPAGTVYH